MATTEQDLDRLKQKYSTVLAAIEREHASLSEVHYRDEKLWLKGEAPSQQAKDSILQALESANPRWHNEVQADIRVPGDESPHTGQTTVNTSQDFSKQDQIHTPR